MFRFLARLFTKQFLFGRLFLWVKPKLAGILTLLLVIFLIFYVHNEYLKFIEFTEKFSGENFIGLSFIIKNLLVILAIAIYLIFVFFLNKTKNTKIPVETPQSTNDEKAESLDFLLEDDELDRKK